MRAIEVRQVLALAETIAAELSATALDRGVDLTQDERRALVALSLAIEAGAARATGILPRTAEAEAVLAKAMLATVVDNDNSRHGERGC